MAPESPLTLRIVTALTVIGGLLLLLCLAATFTGCATINEHRPPPADWPALKTIVHNVSHTAMRDKCSKYVPWFAQPEACMEWHFAKGECHIWFSADFPPQRWMMEHEQLHCRGYDHYGVDTARKAWERYKSATGRE